VCGADNIFRIKTRYIIHIRAMAAAIPIVKAHQIGQCNLATRMKTTYQPLMIIMPGLKLMTSATPKIREKPEAIRLYRAVRTRP